MSLAILPPVPSSAIAAFLILPALGDPLGDPAAGEKPIALAPSHIQSSGLSSGHLFRPSAGSPASLPLLGSGSDDCSTPQLITGSGTSFDCTAATTGSEGQSNLTCLAFSQTGIAHDVWFEWVPDFSGLVDITTCPMDPSYDTRIAIYEGAGCPTGEPLECNDDFESSNLCSWLTVEVHSGQSYTIQVGVFPGAMPVSGILDFFPKNLTNTYAYDDGSSESSWGVTNGGELCWIQRFSAIGGSDSIVSIAAAWGSPAFPSSVPDGAPARVMIWDDPNEDGNPADAVLLAEIATTVANVNTDILNTIPVQPPVSVTGKFFVGAALHGPAGEFVAPTSDNWWGMWSWFVGSSTAIDVHCLTCNEFPLQSFGPFVAQTFLLRAEGDESGVTYCFGDGTGAACPCNNFGQLGAGCRNVTSFGAQLYSTGTTSLALDVIALRVVHKPSYTDSLIYMGTLQTNNGLGVVFGDGLRCVSGATKRFPIQNDFTFVQDHLADHFPSAIVPGSTWHFQAWFRDESPFAPCGHGANLSNGLTLTFTP